MTANGPVPRIAELLAGALRELGCGVDLASWGAGAGGGSVLRRAMRCAGDLRQVRFSNPDVRVETCDGVTLAEALDQPSVGILAFPFREGDGTGPAAPFLRAYPLWWSGVLKNSWGLLQPSSWGDPITKFSTYPRKAGVWASGALFGVPIAVWARAGGFDERFFLYYEDIDLSYRVRKMGYQVKACSALCGVHRHGASSGEAARRYSGAWEVAGWLTYVSKRKSTSRARLAARMLAGNLVGERFCIDIALRLLPASLKLREKRDEVGRLYWILGEGLSGKVDPAVRSPAGLIAKATG